MDVTVRQLTPDLWPAFEELFGNRGAASRCWCMYWRIGAEYRQRPAEENRAGLRQLVDNGPPPGLVALAGDLVVGWCQVTPRHEINHHRPHTAIGGKPPISRVPNLSGQNN